jgi:6-phosphogluconate dehydrogenase
VYDLVREPVDRLVAEGATGAVSLEELVRELRAPCSVWVMVPAAFTGEIVEQLAALLQPRDVIVDGGNSSYRHDIARAEALLPRGIDYLDCGTSGGVWGLERGYCLMIGGEAEAVRQLEPVFRSLAPGLGSIERTPGRTGDPGPAEHGYLHCGPSALATS